MSGLDCSEVNASNIICDPNSDYRLESEYYSKIYDNMHLKLSKVETVRLSSLVKRRITTGHTPSMKNAEYYKGDIKFIKTDNLRDNYIKEPFKDYLSTLGNECIKNSELQENDIITTIIGATHEVVGRSCIVNKTLLPANINQNIALIRPDKKKIDPYFLNSYMQSYYAKSYLHWLSRQTGQVNLNSEEVGKLKIVRFSNKFEDAVSSVNIESNNLNLLSNQKLLEAEKILMVELELEDFNPSKEKISVRSFSEVAHTERWDAEYYQPKYDEILGLIQSVPYTKLGNIVNIEKSIEPGSGAYQAEGIPFLRVQDLTIYGFEETEIHLDTVKYKDTLRVKSGTILLTKDGTVGIAYKAEQDMNVITSGAILHLHLNNPNINSDYLTLVLNSPVVKLQAEQDAGGSVIQHWKPSEIENVVIPLLPLATQEKISQKVRESFTLRQQSLRLLEATKRSVEIAIEQDENAALAYLKSQTELYTDADGNLRGDRTYLKVAESDAGYEVETTKGASDHEQAR